jgi:hypothetical protein
VAKTLRPPKRLKKNIDKLSELAQDSASLWEKEPFLSRQATRLSAHALAVSVLENVSTLLEPMLEEELGKDTYRKRQSKPNLDEPPKQEPIKKPEFTGEQEYHWEVFQCVSNITHAMQRLDEIPIYLGRFPNSATFKKREITLYTWTHYHYTNYLVTIVGLYDNILLLTNAIFTLGLDPKNCNDGTVTRNRKVQRTEAKSAIDGLNGIIKIYREPRNLFVHRGQHPTLEWFDMFEHARQMQSYGLERKRIRSQDFEWLYKRARHNIAKDLRSETVKVADAIVKVFDALYPIYLESTARFK